MGPLRFRRPLIIKIQCALCAAKDFNTSHGTLNPAGVKLDPSIRSLTFLAASAYIHAIKLPAMYGYHYHLLDTNRFVLSMDWISRANNIPDRCRKVLKEQNR